MTRLTAVLMAVPFLAMAAAMVRLAVLVAAAAAEAVLAADFTRAGLQFVIAFVLLAFAGQSWRFGWSEVPHGKAE